MYQNDEVVMYELVSEIEPLKEFCLAIGNFSDTKIDNFVTRHPDMYVNWEKLLQFFNLTQEDLTQYTYENIQERWIQNNIPKKSKILFSYYTGVFPFEGYNARHTNDIRLSDIFKKDIDFLFIHSTRRKANELPRLFEDLKEKQIYKKFYDLFYFGSGWEICALKEGLEE